MWQAIYANYAKEGIKIKREQGGDGQDKKLKC
jgi:hypothetical protein